MNALPGSSPALGLEHRARSIPVLIDVERLVANVANDSDDLARRWRSIFAALTFDHDVLAQRLGAREVTARKRLVNYDYGRRIFGVALVKTRPRDSGMLSARK